MPQYHIHVDAEAICEDFCRWPVERCGFWRTDFAGHPENEEAFGPAHHLTLKPTNANEFNEMFDRVEQRAGRENAMAGYIEGEV